jgi:nitric oxide dioxygenase
MTPEQITLVESVIARAGASDVFATRFYERLFETAPDTKAMFSDVDGQRDKLRSELTALVDLIRDLGALEREAGQLGGRHRGYGVTAAHYRFARNAMEGALEDSLGDDFGAQEREAWRRAYDLIAELMQS